MNHWEVVSESSEVQDGRSGEAFFSEGTVAKFLYSHIQFCLAKSLQALQYFRGLVKMNAFLKLAIFAALLLAATPFSLSAAISEHSGYVVACVFTRYSY